jgi:hypothetical protein
MQFGAASDERYVRVGDEDSLRLQT